MQPASVWYADWTFWSNLVAWFTFLLLVIPKIRMYLKKSAFTCEVHHSTQMTHKLGATNLSWNVKFENVGGKDVDIRKITVFCEDASGTGIVLPAQSYFVDKFANASIFTGFRIKPGETWQAYLWLIESLTREEERELRGLESSARLDIQLGQTTGVPPILSQPIHERCMAFFHRRFKPVANEYLVRIEVETSDGKLTNFSGYRFTLFDTDIAELVAYSERYINGDGVYWYSDFPSWIRVEVKR